MNQNHAAARSSLALTLAIALVAGAARADEPKRAEDPAPFTIGVDNTQRRKVTLHEALELASKQSPDVAAARAQAAVAQASVSKAYSAWRPDVNAGLTFDHTSAPQVLDFGQIAIQLGQVFGLPVDPNKAAQIPPTTIVAENSWYGNAQISQPLFTPQGVFLPGIAKR
ncbi:MAG: TolC family protein, partial [Deltaproteobacteria bacterium]|nr:TolC family protein [Deltaproteobacteria bacterium]